MRPCFSSPASGNPTPSLPRFRALALLLLSLAGLLMPGCAGSRRSADLRAIYDQAAQNIGADRNPVIVIPGILGTKLESETTMRPVWGSFTYGAADPDTPEGARLVALPMEPGTPLADIRDDVIPTTVLDTLALDVGLLRGVELGAYIDILRTLAAGDYRDEMLGESGAIDYGGLHYTCFQFPYDWRRDVAEQAAALHDHVLAALAAQPVLEDDAKVDIVAHSMGGLVLRYYLRYGPTPMPEDGSLPELDWEGAQLVENAILVGTPSAGSVLALEQLVEGVNFASLITPTYRPAVLGTMPAIYQLLPRTRHARVIDRATGEAVDLYDPETWKAFGWGLADPNETGVLRDLLPDAESDEARRAIATDHLTKCLDAATRLHRALDVPATPPPGLNMMLVAGDAHPTPDVVEVGTGGRLRVASRAPGDNTVTRASALMDERVGSGYAPRLRTPARFASVVFLEADHLGLTRDPLFTNVVLYTLLEKPKPAEEPSNERGAIEVGG